MLVRVEEYRAGPQNAHQVCHLLHRFGIRTGGGCQAEKPLLKEIYGTALSLSPAKVFLHSCGSVFEFIEDFIEIGVDILNPVQTSAARMDVETLKQRFGERITFWGGGADVQRVLPRGTPGEVRRDVRQRIEVMQSGGGFVFAPIHNLQADIPPENIASMYGEARSG